MYKKISCCRVCQSTNLNDVLSLGELAVSDFVDDTVTEPGIKAPLELVLCDTERGGVGCSSFDTLYPAKLCIEITGIVPESTIR